MAHRQFRHLQKLMQARGLQLPVVKLDLGAGGCRSAIVGLMTQPGKEKVCTFQACVMALRQLGEDEATCQALFSELDEWIAYILRKRIKLGKVQLKLPRGLTGIDSPSDNVMSALIEARNPRWGEEGVEKQRLRRQQHREEKAAAAAAAADGAVAVAPIVEGKGVTEGVETTSAGGSLGESLVGLPANNISLSTTKRFAVFELI